MSEKTSDLDVLLRNLPREIEPARDLWPEIFARLETQQAPQEQASQQHAPLGAPSLWRRLSESLRLPVIETWHGWAWQGAMAALCLLIGASLTQSPVSNPSAGPEVDRQSSVVLPASFEATSFEATTESDLLRLKDDLWAAAYERRSELSEETLEVVEANLQIIDSALRDLQLALEADPGNRYLQGRIVDHHRKEIHLLRRLAYGTENV